MENKENSAEIVEHEVQISSEFITAMFDFISENFPDLTVVDVYGNLKAAAEILSESAGIVEG